MKLSKILLFSALFFLFFLSYCNKSDNLKYDSSKFIWYEVNDSVLCRVEIAFENSEDVIILNPEITSVREEPTCINEGKVTYTATIFDDDGNKYTDRHVFN